MMLCFWSLPADPVHLIQETEASVQIVLEQCWVLEALITIGAVGKRRPIGKHRVIVLGTAMAQVQVVLNKEEFLFADNVELATCVLTIDLESRYDFQLQQHNRGSYLWFKAYNCTL